MYKMDGIGGIRGSKWMLSQCFKDNRLKSETGYENEN